MNRRPTGQTGRSSSIDPGRRGLRALIAALALVLAMAAMTLPAGAGADVTEPAADPTATTTWIGDTSDTTVPAADDTTSTTEADPTGLDPTTPEPTTDTTIASEAVRTTQTTAPAELAEDLVAVPAAASITVTPSTLLVQGDTVTVSGSGFPGNSLIGIIQCKVPSAGVEDCNSSTLSYTNTNAAGTFSTSFTPRRILIVAGSPIDCSVADACKIGAGAVADQSVTDDFPIQFDPTVPPPPPPTLSVTPSTDLLNGQTVTVTGTNYPANTMVALLECLDPPSTDPFNCGSSTGQYTTSDASGNISFDYTVRRVLRVNGTSTDCATPGACVLLSGVQEIGDGATAPITFDGTVPLPPPPAITVTPDTDLLDGDTVTVVGSGFEPNYPVAVLECPTSSNPQTCPWGSQGFVQADETGAFTVELILDRILYTDTDTIDCAVAGACQIAVLELLDGFAGVTAPIQFDPSVPPPPPPSITITPATDVVDGQLITVRGTGFSTRSNVGVVQCQTGATGAPGCDLSNLGQARVDPDGTFTFSYRVSRFIQTSQGRIDCAVAGACTIGAGTLPNGRPGANTPILFTTVVPTTPSDVEAADQVAVTPSFTG